MEYQVDGVTLVLFSMGRQHVAGVRDGKGHKKTLTYFPAHRKLIAAIQLPNLPELQQWLQHP